jgi:hypothetical protein
VSNDRRILFLFSLLASVGLLACTIIEDLGFGGGPSKPSVEILSPPSGSQVALGQQVEVQYQASDRVGVARVLLEADGSVVDSERSPSVDGQPSMSGVLRWAPTTPGSHTLVVYAYNGDGVPSDPVGVSIIATQEPGVEPAATPALPAPIDTPVPPATGEPTATLVPPAPTDTSVPPAPASPTAPGLPTATRTSVPPTPVPPTPTTPRISCPTLTIIVPDVVVGRPSRAFGIQFQRVGELPAGYGYVIEYSWDQAAWERQDPVPASVRQDGVYWMAEARGLGVTGTSYWQLCLVDLANLGATSVCCTPPWAIQHTG